MDSYIDFKVASYCLPKLFLALDSSGIKEFAITQEDNDLHIRISKNLLVKLVYPEHTKGEITQNGND